MSVNAKSSINADKNIKKDIHITRVLRFTGIRIWKESRLYSIVLLLAAVAIAICEVYIPAYMGKFIDSVASHVNPDPLQQEATY